MNYNSDRPQSLDLKDRKRIDGRTIVKDVPPPFEEIPYNLYHPDNLNSIKCCSTVAFLYYIARHILKSQMEDVGRRIVAERVKKILEMLVLSKNLFSTVIHEAGKDMDLSRVLPL